MIIYFWIYYLLLYVLLLNLFFIYLIYNKLILQVAKHCHRHNNIIAFIYVIKYIKFTYFINIIKFNKNLLIIINKLIM